MAGRKAVDIAGQRFGRLVAVAGAKQKSGHAQWACVCDCGGITQSAGDDLRSGKTKSCGCLKAELGSQRMRNHNPNPNCH